MKTTLEIPDPLFRRAKSLAAKDGKSLKQFVNEALEEKLTAQTLRARPAWMELFGSLKGHAAEFRRIDALVSEEFEQIDAEDWK